MKDTFKNIIEVGDYVAFYQGTNHVWVGEVSDMTNTLVVLMKPTDPRFKRHWFLRDGVVIRKNAQSVIKINKLLEGE